MPNEPMLSVTSLHTVSGASVAVLLIVQLIKNMPIIRWVPAKWLAVVIGEVLMFGTSTPPATTSDGVVLFLNGLQAAFAAIGGYQIFTGGSCQRSRPLLRFDEEHEEDRDERGHFRGA